MLELILAFFLPDCLENGREHFEILKYAKCIHVDLRPATSDQRLWRMLYWISAIAYAQLN